MSDTVLRIYFSEHAVVGAFSHDWLENPANAKDVEAFNEFFKKSRDCTNISWYEDVTIPEGASTVYFWYWFYRSDGSCDYGFTFNQREAYNRMYQSVSDYPGLPDYAEDDDYDCSDLDCVYDSEFTSESKPRTVFYDELRYKCDGNIFAFPLRFANKINKKLIKEIKTVRYPDDYMEKLRNNDEEILRAIDN
jgi:hypothetical protein